MYKDTSIPSNYSKIAEINNNYTVWVKESKLNSGTSYDAYYQFYYPSTWVLHVDNYRIKTGDSYTFDANYTNNGMYSYIDNYTTSYSLNTMTCDADYFSVSDYDRGDFLNIFVVQVIICIVFVWVFSNVSRLFFKGGLH